jgi:Fanconi anemia group M protein
VPGDQIDLSTFLEEGLPEEPAGPDPQELGFVEHPMVEPETLEDRPYQRELAEGCLGERTLVVLPTGLGKTIVAVRAAAEVLQRREGKVVMLAPTRPLVGQHHETFDEFLRARDLVTLTGSVKPAGRAERFDEHRLIFATPEAFRNDLADRRYDLTDVALLVVDEAHRAVGDYAYVDVVHRYRQDRPDGTLLGLTASPGGDEARIEEVAENLGVTQVEGRDAESPDVAPYVKETKVTWVRVPLDDQLEDVAGQLQEVVDERAEPLKRSRYLPPKPFISRKDAIEAGEKIRAELDNATNKGPLFGLLHNQGVVMQGLHAVELAETQGLEPLRDYLARQSKDPGSKAARAFLGDQRVADVFARVKDHEGPSHPKIDALVRVLEEELADNPGGLIIVFAQYRDTIASIVRALDEAGIEAAKFVGQADRDGDEGMSQDEQRAVIERFREGEFRVLVASSVAEEGLDIPDVDLVVFYEPVPSEIRLIQRRGRTGRERVGRMVVLLSEDTRDEAFMHAAQSRERKMRRLVRDLDVETLG